jgi:transcription-repair coupling factor (superfamily II helicase)
MAKLSSLLALWDRTDLLDRILEEGEAGVPAVARAMVVAGLADRAAPLVVVLPRSREAEAFAAELELWLGPPPERPAMPGQGDRYAGVALFPAWEVLPGESMSPTLETMGRRIRVLRDLAAGRGAAVVVAPVRAFLQRVAEPPLEEGEDGALMLAPGASVELEDAADRLAAFGYESNYLVERPGEFAVRGGILDVFPPGRHNPVRADFFGDEITSLREFSVSSQRSRQEVAGVEVLPVRELTPGAATRARAALLLERLDPEQEDVAGDLERLANGLVFPGMEAYLPMVGGPLSPLASRLPAGPGGGAVVVLDPKQVQDRASDFLAQAADWAASSSFPTGPAGDGASSLFAGFDEASAAARRIDLWPYGRGEEGINLDVVGWDEHVGRPDRLAEALAALRSAGSAVVVAPGTYAERARQVLADAGLGLAVQESVPDLGRGNAQPAVVVDAPVDAGFLLRLPAGTLEAGGDEPEPHPVLALVGAGDLFGKRRPVSSSQREAPARAASLLLQLAAGDYVVHELYGVGRYEGMVTREVGGVSRDYLRLSYHGDDRLYVPTEQLEAVTKYTGGEAPRLNKLGTAEWEKSKSRARRAVRELAGDLVGLYAKRIRSKGHHFGPDTPWQRQLEDAFPHVETPDQTKAIQDVKEDMERPIPMDRLICGDVGFGKTEVAIRAAFKAVQDSKQVAILVPTTILAQQHTQTFRDRFAGFPVEVAQLSRFLTDKEQSEVLERLAAGRVDVVIGTHRLLSSDVKFHDLGLLVVDEEQRFGVRHKEAIKKLKTSVDVLTMSATPIPRTLEMGLTGIRDMSLVDTPPVDRRPVMTYVGPSDDRMVTAAIRRELARDGQVFYVHNRVQTIHAAARRIAGLVPGARIDVAHGQMSEHELERVMLDVWDGKVDVLVTTTIIESGLDIPAMNTLIVERADRLGLAQLYQLRGRVGRARERAYAYCFYRDEAALSVEAHERLKTLSEYTELGSGFKIALRDLEIRGAGNLLGAEQSGHIAAVGFDLYLKMMSEAVHEVAGTAVEDKQLDIKLELPVDAFVPPTYIARESLRMEAYRQIERVRTPEDAASLREELEDRYGPLPEPVANLLVVAELRAFLALHGITEATVRQGVLKIRPLPQLSDSQEVRLRRTLRNATYKPTLDTLIVPVPSTGLASWMLETLVGLLGPAPTHGEGKPSP